MTTETAAALPAIPPLAGWRIAEERERLGLTQAELAAKLAIGKQKMRAIEAGSQRPLTMQLMGYLAHSGVDVHYVLIGQRVLPSGATGAAGSTSR